MSERKQEIIDMGFEKAKETFNIMLEDKDWARSKENCDFRNLYVNIYSANISSLNKDKNINPEDRGVYIDLHNEDKGIKEEIFELNNRIFELMNKSRVLKMKMKDLENDMRVFDKHGNLQWDVDPITKKKTVKMQSV